MNTFGQAQFVIFFILGHEETFYRGAHCRSNFQRKPSVRFIFCIFHPGNPEEFRFATYFQLWKSTALHVSTQDSSNNEPTLQFLASSIDENNI